MADETGMVIQPVTVQCSEDRMFGNVQSSIFNHIWSIRKDPQLTTRLDTQSSPLIQMSNHGFVFEWRMWYVGGSNRADVLGLNLVRYFSEDATELEVRSQFTLIYVVEDTDNATDLPQIRTVFIEKHFATMSPDKVQKELSIIPRYLEITHPRLYDESTKLLTVQLKIEIAQQVNDHGKLVNDLQVHLSDVTLQVGAKEFKAHKLILMARSSVFAKMFTCDMLEKTTNKVKIDDVETDIFEEVLEFMYCGKTSNLEDAEFGKIAALMRAADKYAVNDLKLICARYIEKHMDIQKAAEVLVLSDQLQLQDLKIKSMKFILANRKQIIETDSYKQLVKSCGHLVIEIFSHTELE